MISDLRHAGRTERDATQLIPTLRKALQSLDPALPFVNVTTMDEAIRQGLWASRTGAALLSVFGALALLLATIGVYGIMSYTVGKRTREIGIRMAIGAQRHDVFRLILGQALVITAIGLAVGLVAAFFVARYFQNFLFRVGAGDVLTYVVITIVLSTVALLACFLPAQRATKVDPLVALRTE